MIELTKEKYENLILHLNQISDDECLLRSECINLCYNENKNIVL